MRRFLWIYPCFLLAITGCNSAPPAETDQSNPAAVQSDIPLSISSPGTEDKVGQELLMKGTAPAGQRVWLIVHPQGTPDYWIQPSASANGEGQWKNIVYIGRSGQGDVGLRYEIRAVAEPKTPLIAGKVLKAWPEALLQSDILKVTRK